MEHIIETFKNFKKEILSHEGFTDSCGYICNSGFCIWDRIEKIELENNEEKFRKYAEQVFSFFNKGQKITTFCFNQVIKLCCFSKISPYKASTLIYADGFETSFKACSKFKNCVTFIDKTINLLSDRIESLEIE